jgi:hypothetical protein
MENSYQKIKCNFIYTHMLTWYKNYDEWKNTMQTVETLPLRGGHRSDSREKGCECYHMDNSLGRGL